ncbi:hypothetical protein ACIB24_00600 [Spongisporangium articulatum]|uniref:Uncharacterized protein n=1 Tax=Spongisporangium articulatum TaxID=3362603 RepID=A0ABW8AGS6_9ACTN
MADDDALVEALGALSEALEKTERARGHLYEFHQLTGSADGSLDAVMDGLRKAGHAEAADRLQRELVGLDVLEGRWTYQVIEEYDDGYYATFKRLERELRDELGVPRHEHERRMKRDRQS